LSYIYDFIAATELNGISLNDVALLNKSSQIRAMGSHLGSQCYLPPDTSERALLDRLVLD